MNEKRVVVVWLLIAVAETVHGTLRRLFLVPLIGLKPSSQIGMLIGSGIIFAIAWLSAGWLGLESFRRQLQAGALWVVLTLIFEFSLGLAFGYSQERILADYNLAEGGLMPLGILFMLFAPTLARRARGLS
jgi:hypothetical protein